MNNKKLFVAAMALLMAGAAQAQERNWKSYSYVEAQGGVQMTATDGPMERLLTPTVALSFGHYFTPVVGARLHVNAWQAKGYTDRYWYYTDNAYSSASKTYRWNYFTPNLDVMLNLSNLFSKSTNHPLNVIVLGGIGLNYAWHNDDLLAINLPADVAPLAWKNDHLSHNLRAGLRLETNQAKPIGLSFEVNANSLNDRFNSKRNNSDDWQFTAMLGINVRFGRRYQAPRIITKTITVVDTVWVDEPTTIIVKEKRAVEKMEHKKMEEAIFFNIRESNADEASNIDAAIKKVADLMKTSDDAKFTVTGYADKGTGTPAINKKYAMQRAKSVTEKLVNQHGLDASRITSDSKGDTVQPFAENDKNRCVIVTGEGTFKVTTYEDVEVEKPSTKKVMKTENREMEIQEQVD